MITTRRNLEHDSKTIDFVYRKLFIKIIIIIMKKNHIHDNVTREKSQLICVFEVSFINIVVNLFLR